MDTVGGDLDKIFRPTKKGERLHGRGACDTKGSVAVMFHAMEHLANDTDRPTRRSFSSGSSMKSVIKPVPAHFPN